jgi:hypothetical protein
MASVENSNSDVVVVGAGKSRSGLFISKSGMCVDHLLPGVTGIIAAQRYLDAHPEARLVILEKDSCIGGVFSKRK